MYPKEYPLEPTPTRPRSRGGFTLIELLMVMAVVLILVGITFGISRGVQNAQARTKAKAELAVIAQALEQFKSTYGDYPWISGNPTTTGSSNGEDLFLALTGWSVLKKNEDGDVALTPVGTNEQRKSFLDPLKMSLSKDYGDPSAPGDLDGVQFLDPWGAPYAYVYDGGSNNWDAFGYVLFSMGADRVAGFPGSTYTSGIMEQSDRDDSKNVDNIYAGE